MDEVLDERKRKILKAIIKTYMETGEPVGSRTISKYPDLNVLKVSPGFVKLDGYDTGFIGGTSGRVGDEIIFHGDLFVHPDFQRIVSFIEKRGLTCRWFSDFKLTDIGSIL